MLGWLTRETKCCNTKNYTNAMQWVKRKRKKWWYRRKRNERHLWTGCYHKQIGRRNVHMCVSDTLCHKFNICSTSFASQLARSSFNCLSLLLHVWLFVTCKEFPQVGCKGLKGLLEEVRYNIIGCIVTDNSICTPVNPHWSDPLMCITGNVETRQISIETKTNL